MCLVHNNKFCYLGSLVAALGNVQSLSVELTGITCMSTSIAVKFWVKTTLAAEIPLQHSWYLSHISLLPMLLLVLIEHSALIPL